MEWQKIITSVCNIGELSAVSLGTDGPRQIGKDHGIFDFLLKKWDSFIEEVPTMCQISKQNNCLLTNVRKIINRIRERE